MEKLRFTEEYLYRIYLFIIFQESKLVAHIYNVKMFNLHNYIKYRQNLIKIICTISKQSLNKIYKKNLSKLQ